MVALCDIEEALISLMAIIPPPKGFDLKRAIPMYYEALKDSFESMDEFQLTLKACCACKYFPQIHDFLGKRPIGINKLFQYPTQQEEQKIESTHQIEYQGAVSKEEWRKKIDRTPENLSEAIMDALNLLPEVSKPPGIVGSKPIYVWLGRQFGHSRFNCLYGKAKEEPAVAMIALIFGIRESHSEKWIFLDKRGHLDPLKSRGGI